MDKNNIITILSNEKAFIQENFHIEILGIFGSYSTNEATEKSDVDILFELDNTYIDDLYENKEALKFFLESKFQKKVDLCRIKFIKPFLKKYILKNAIYV